MVRENSDYRTNLILIFSVILVSLIIVEIISYILILNSDNPEDIFSRLEKEEEFPQKSFYIFDKELGYKGRPNATHTKVISRGNKILNVTYNLDGYGRRITPESKSNHSVLFFGGSFMFGDKVDDNETLPYYFSEKAGIQVYNYAYQGHGTQHLLAQLQRDEISGEIKIPPKAIIYLFISDHVPRVIGDMRVYNEWGYDFPYYYLKNNELKRKGSFTTGRKLKSTIYKLLGKSSFFKYFNIVFPKFDEDQIYLTYRIIEEAKYLSETKLNSSFYVIIRNHDNLTFNNQEMANTKLRKLLEENKISIITYEFGTSDELYFDDGHPKSELNRKLADKIIKDLNLDK